MKEKGKAHLFTAQGTCLFGLHFDSIYYYYCVFVYTLYVYECVCTLSKWTYMWRSQDTCGSSFLGPGD